MTFLTTTAVKKLVVDLMKSLAKQTTNTLDDKAVEILEKQLFPWHGYQKISQYRRWASSFRNEVRCWNAL